MISIRVPKTEAERIHDMARLMFLAGIVLTIVVVGILL